MRYFYEYKYKNGGKVAGHNLKKIIIDGNIIVLRGVDIIPTFYDYEYSHWEQIIDMNTIEYLKIEPMQELEEGNSNEV